MISRKRFGVKASLRQGLTWWNARTIPRPLARGASHRCAASPTMAWNPAA
ncbi:hypothetical protein ACFQFG_17185 [Methylobacterium persicinum]